MERLTIPDEPIDGGIKRALIDGREVRKYATTLYWRLKEYEDTGLTPEKIREMDRLYAEMCKELAEERKKHRWIPVEERLPEEGQKVICCFAHGTVTELWFYEGLFHGLRDYAPGVIIAWQPLPEPYKDERIGKEDKSK